ncbi:hypothetical protein KJ641_01675 [Patescibacteria group bacterium]|nr:hypothetical protein [Patescibacteria group bacterium]MBU1895560.1 hypothetical protein [Patescibacteria group bacterium]
MSEISKKIIEKIKDEQIKPNERWKLLMRDYSVWALGGFSILVGGFAVGVSIYLLTDHDWVIYKATERNFWTTALMLIPYFWLIILIIFGIISFYNVRHTKRGYKYQGYLIIMISIIFSLLLGGILFATGLGEKIDEALYTNVKPYRQLIKHRSDMWQTPTKGRIAGKIIEIREDKNIVIVAFGGNEWLIDITDAKRHPAVRIKIDQIIMILGEPIQNDYFIATEILPWMGNNLQNKSFLFKNGKPPVIERIFKQRAY